ncbi:MAG: phosphohistidine phosphatase SixA [Anaerolineales bacterium]|nr:phosphohistidine phosphatase SixA [Anaerolineales bacterium]MBX3035777.1 phosphohistidine phosphatase SixA [Anaerolineales bacterium]
MNLYIIRHAIAEEEHPSGDDSQRRLTDKGAKKMRQIAKGLRALGVDFDLILSSPFTRAKETAEILGEVFKMKKKISFSDNLIPIGDPDLLIAEINEKYTVDSLALVGHEPYLTTLVSLLVGQTSAVDMTLKKGGVCLLSTEDLRHTRRATLEWLLTPGVLVEIGNK